MICPACNEETNPTLVYCQNCGGPTQADEFTVFKDQERKAREMRAVEATKEAKNLLTLALFMLGCVIALRVVLIKEPNADGYTSYRVPYSIVEEAAGDPPPAVVDVERREIPFPESE